MSRASRSASDILRTGDRSHLRAVKRDHAAANKTMIAAELDKRRAGGHDGFGIIMSESSNGPVVRCKATHEPKSFEIPDTGTLEMTL